MNSRDSKKNTANDDLNAEIEHVLRENWPNANSEGVWKGSAPTECN